LSVDYRTVITYLSALRKPGTVVCGASSLGAGLANVTLVGVERVRKSLIGGRERKPPLCSQVSDERFHFELNVWRQSPQSSPVEHLGPLFLAG
jgi:hypothetical protein